MGAATLRRPLVCWNCLVTCRAARRAAIVWYSSSPPERFTDKPRGEASIDDGGSTRSDEARVGAEKGAMTRRLEEATEEALLGGGKAGLRAVQDASFSDELKEKLLGKISHVKFRSDFPAALGEAGLTPAAGAGTRHTAVSSAWTGQEQTEDAVLRMLDDARKPLKPELRGKYQMPPVDARLKKRPVLSAGQQVANARDRVSVYADLDMKNRKGLSEEERGELRREFRERFQAGARAMPNTISGLAALANERIEDAIARGQFKDLPRSKVEPDVRSSNPFIDTTEYIMNKMIQRQDIVPPWIEKQQELVRAANTFRQRLRNDWRRHAARMIASRGGSLLDQMKRAEEYAASELLHNPRHGSADRISASTTSTSDPVSVKVPQESQDGAQTKTQMPTAKPGEEPDTARPLPQPFRDAAWERAEKAYMTLSINNLNAIARSYNLMAPDLAKKPYFSLQRELARCYAEVAPQLAGEIRDRAAGRRSRPGLAGGTVMEKSAESIMGHFGGKDSVRIHLEAEEKAYGLREFWRDLWKRS